PPPLQVTVATQQSAHTLESHRDWINGLTLGAKDKLLVSGDDAGVVIVWERGSAQELRRWQVKGWAFAVALSPDDQQAFVSERKPLVFDSGRHVGAKLWDVTRGEMQRDLGAEVKDLYVAAAAYSPDGKLLALGRGGETDANGGGKVYL